MNQKVFMIILPSTVIILWFILSEYQIIPPLYLPRPIDIIKSYRAQLLNGVLITTLRLIVGLLVGLFLSIFIHFICVKLNVINFMDSNFTGARAVPATAIMPLFVMWFGFSEIGRVILVAISAFLMFLVPFHESYKILGREWTILREQQSLGLTKYYIHIVVPGSMTTLLGPLRITVVFAFTVAIAADYIGAQYGIGKFIDSARVTFNIAGIFLGIFVASLLGIIFDRIVLLTFHRYIHWTKEIHRE